MKQTKTSAETYDISKDLYLDRSLYEHDHKDTHTKDILTLVTFNLRERTDTCADKIIEIGLLYN